jgi:hypothetical protein
MGAGARDGPLTHGDREMTEQEWNAIQLRAVRIANAVTPAWGTSRERVLTIARHFEVCSGTYHPSNDEMDADLDALIDVVKRLDEAERDRAMLIREVERLRREIDP